MKLFDRGHWSNNAQNDKEKDDSLCVVHSIPYKKRKYIDLAKDETDLSRNRLRNFSSGEKKIQTDKF